MGSYNVATSKAVNLEFIQASNSPVIPNVPLFSGNLITNEEINSIINLLQNNDKANVIIATEIIKSKVELSKIVKL